MDITERCTYLDKFPVLIFGHEDPPKPADPKPKPKEEEVPPKEDDDPDEDEDEDDDEDEHDDKDDPKTKGLRSALAKERAAAKANARELKKLQKEKAERELAGKSESEQEKAKREAAESKLTKLAEGFKRTAVTSAIEKAAAKAGFIDTQDAVDALINSDDLGVEQDEDDPSDVTIDPKSIEKAVKALATKKPHFLKSGTEDGEPTGGQFGGSKQKKPTGDEEILAKYPSLRR